MLDFSVPACQSESLTRPCSAQIAGEPVSRSSCHVHDDQLTAQEATGTSRTRIQDPWARTTTQMNHRRGVAYIARRRLADEAAVGERVCKQWCQRRKTQGTVCDVTLPLLSSATAVKYVASSLVLSLLSSPRRRRLAVARRRKACKTRAGLGKGRSQATAGRASAS